MKDNPLYEYIRNIVKEKQNTKDSQPTTFAQKFCKQQLKKKKLNTHNPHQKMTILMKNFRQLDTYVDLPQLIQSIKKWKFRQFKQAQQPKPSLIIRQLKNDENLNKKIKKQLGQKIKEKYLNQNAQADEVLNFLQNHTTIRSDGLKNHSYSNLNNLFEQVQKQGDDQTWKGNFDFLDIFNKVNKLQKMNQQKNMNKKDEKIMQSELNSKVRKQYTKLLHKVTTYLQIILQTEHKQKWSNKKYNHKSQHIFPNLQKNNKDQHLFSNIQKSNINNHKNLLNLSEIKQYQINKNKYQQLSESKYFNQTQFINKNGFNNKNEFNNKKEYISKTVRPDQLKKSKFIHKKQLTQSVDNLTNYKQKFVNSSKNYTPYQQSQNKQNSNAYPVINRSNLFKSLHSQSISKQNTTKRNDSFYRTTSSFKFRTQAILDQYPPQRKNKKYGSLIKQRISQKQVQNKRNKQTVKQNFTFRNRNIKQKIVNKLSNFIRQIDQQEHNNKKQNNYYNTAINKLQNTLSMCFGQFKQQSVACDADIQTLQKYAYYYNRNGSNQPFATTTYKQLLTLNQGGLFALNTHIPSRSDIDVQVQANNQMGYSLEQNLKASTTLE